MSDREVLARQAAEAEVAVIAAVLLDADVAEECFEILREDHFAGEVHRIIWRAFTRIREEHKPIDPVLLKEMLERMGKLEAVTLEYLVYLGDAVPTAVNAPHHAKIIRNRALERRILEAADDVKQAVGKADLQGEELAAKVEQRILTATADDLPEIPRSMRELIWPVMDQIDQRRDGPDHLIGVTSGITDLDHMTAGWRPGQYVVLAARPSEGKTALALHGALSAAQAGKKVLFISLEMSTDELMVRSLAHEAGIDSRRLELSRVRDEEFPKLSRAVAVIGQLPMWIDDTPTRTVSSIRAVARRWRRREGIEVVYVDYLQLAHPDRVTRDRVEAVTEISKGLKGLARELQIPVVTLCQLSRAPEGRPDSRPRLSDLRESGAIEQDADVVVFIWNDPELKGQIRPPTTLIVGKQRNGPKGDVKVLYDRHVGHWDAFHEDPRERVA